MLFESDIDSSITYEELPKNIEIAGLSFLLLCSTISSSSSCAHFKAIFEIEKRSYLVDVLKTSAVEYVPEDSITSYSLYVFINQ